MLKIKLITFPKTKEIGPTITPGGAWIVWLSSAMLSCKNNCVKKLSSLEKTARNKNVPRGTFWCRVAIFAG